MSASRPTAIGRTEALSLIPSAMIATNAAALLDVAQVGGGQAIILGRVLACGLQTVLRNGLTNLITLTRVWPTLRVTLDR
jgi:hypothetical protein